MRAKRSAAAPESSAHRRGGRGRPLLEHPAQHQEVRGKLQAHLAQT